MQQTTCFLWRNLVSPFPSSEWCTAHGMQAVSKCTCGKLGLPLLIHTSAGTGRISHLHQCTETVLLCTDQNWWGEREHTPYPLSLTFVVCWVWQPSSRCLHGISKRGVCPGKVKWLLLLMLPCHSKMKKTPKPRRLCQVLYRTETKGGKHLSSDY